jgi:hypothetical protein
MEHLCFGLLLYDDFEDITFFKNEVFLVWTHRELSTDGS